VPLQTMFDMAEAAGYKARVLSLSWKVQSEPESVIGDYASEQRRGRGQVCNHNSTLKTKVRICSYDFTVLLLCLVGT